MSRKEVLIYRDDFIGVQSLSTSAGDGVWRISDTSSSGSPTYAGVDAANGGAVALTLDNTSEAQAVRMYHGDIKSYDIDKIQYARFICKVAGVEAVTTIAFGLAGNHNSTLDTIAQNAWFRMQGSADTANVVCETDDGTLDNNDIASGQTLAAVYKTFEISFANGTNDVRFYMDDGSGQMRRVASGTTFDMSNYTGSLQPYLACDKASGTGVPALTIDLVEIAYER